ncbi:MAG: KH domain-containing protein [Candidatus Aenigmatarchaeota archaeon]
MIDFVKIPEERLKSFRSCVNKLEKLVDCKIKINDEISIETKDPLLSMRIKEVINAFGRGFDLDSALNLLDEQYYLETINIKEVSGKSKKRMVVVKGRIIGREGEAKKLIEKYTNVKIAIFGKTVSIIGKWDGVQRARQAIESLLQGRKHSTVFKSLMEGRYG